VNFDKLDYCSSLKNLNITNNINYKFVKGDILSADLVSEVLNSESIDTIMHFAAQTHVDNSFGNSFTFTLSNVLGTHVLLEAAKLAKIKRFIHVSTDEVYGELDNDDEPSFEEKVLEPTNPYAATKAAAEFLVKAYNRSFNLPTIITRGNNVYGPHQFPEKVIPKFTLRLQRGLPCCIHGNGLHKRNYMYVEDVANAFDVILHKGDVGQIYNIGTEFEISTLDVAKQLIKHLNLQDKEKELIIHVEDRAFNDKRYAVSAKKLQALGWKTQVSWEHGLKATVDWYSKNWSNWDTKDITKALEPHPKETEYSLNTPQSNVNLIQPIK